MGLVDLKTDLKSIRYGKDTPGGGNSGQPFVVKDIPDGSISSTNYNNFRLDFLLRGGQGYAERVISDDLRISKFLKTTKGILFVTKQELLAKQEAKRAGNIVFTAPDYNYSPFTTLLQLGASRLGIHFDGKGVNPLIDSTSKYAYVYKNASLGLNNLVNIYRDKQAVRNPDTNVLSYANGPTSLIGFSKTYIRFSDQRTGENNPLLTVKVDGQYTWGNGIANSPTDRRDISNINYNNLLGASKKENIPQVLLGFNDQGQQTKVFGPEDDNNTLSKQPSLETFVDGKGYGQGQPTDHESTPINNNDLLGVSISASLKDPQYTGFNQDGQQLKIYGPNDDNSTLTYNSGSYNLVSGSGYGQGLPTNHDKDSRSGNYTSTLVLTNKIKNTVDSGFPNNSNLGTGINNQGATTTYFGVSAVAGAVFGRTVKISNSGSYLEGRKNSPTKFLLFDGGTNNLNVLGASNAFNKVVPAYNIKNNTFNTNGTYQFVLSVYKDNNITQNSNRVNDNKTVTYTSKQLFNAVPFKGGGISGVQDFRRLLARANPSFFNRSDNDVLQNTTDYTTTNRETKVKLGDPGKRNKKVATYNLTSGMGALDKINASGIGASIQDDYCIFYIGVINTDTALVTNIQFRAFIDSFSDKYDATWNEEQILGRGEKFYRYGGFGRSVSLSFTVAAQSVEEVAPMYKKLNYLASTVAPTYGSGGVMRGNLLQLSIGGYLKQQIGILKGLSLEYFSSDATHNIGLNANGTFNRDRQLSNLIKVSGFEFVPIYNFVPQFNKPFIAAANL